MSDTFIGVAQPGTAAKGWVAVLGAVITTLLAVLQAEAPFIPPAWTPVVIGVSTALTFLAVYFVPQADNKAKPQPPPPGPIGPNFWPT